MNAQSTPTDIVLHRRSRELELSYSNGDSYLLNCEYLRVYSPSAEVKGHGPGQETLQTGKLNVAIIKIVPVGNYALQLVFDDGHDTGLYTWPYLLELCLMQEPWWQTYLQQLDASGGSRDPDVQVIRPL